MPNWCVNKLRLNHTDPAMIEKAKEAAKTGLFQAFVPRPAEEDENWYMWNTHNWGTKWDVEDAEVVEDEDGLVLYYDTAWAPPILFYNELTKLGFSVDAGYSELGMGFVGQYKDGFERMIEIEEMSKDWISKNVPVELIDTFALMDQFDEEEEIEEDG